MISVQSGLAQWGKLAFQLFILWHLYSCQTIPQYHSNFIYVLLKQVSKCSSKTRKDFLIFLNFLIN